MLNVRLFARLLPGFLVLTLLAGCGGSGTPAAPAISVAVSPTSATLIGGATQTFAATVSNDSANAGVTWTASTGAITSAGVYTAPSPVTTTSATVTATSKTDTTKTATATITLTPISVSVLPATATLVAGATQTIVATVTSDCANAGVTWTASVGSITSAGVYTAPTPVTTATATFTATSKTDTTKTATATATLTPIAVSVAPTTATLIGGATQTFTPTVTGDTTLNQGVTWTASTGTITSGGVYTAPAVIMTTSATVTATSKTDPTKTATATVTLIPISLNPISPATISLGTGGSQAFTDTVANDGSNSGVTWSIGTGVGTLTASSTMGVTYNAPTTVISSTTTVTLTATSIKDPTKTTTATITLNPISVLISPASPAAMIGGATQAFTATVANDGSNSGVTWTVTGGGSFSAGATASGTPTTYTAASPVPTATAVVTATSVKDPSKTASATITLNPIAVSFSTVTTGVSLDAGQTLALNASVANDSSASGATFTSTGAGTVNPSSAIGNSPATTLTATGTTASTVTVTATSIKDPTKSATTASIAVNPALAITTAAGVLAGGTTGTAYAGATIAAGGGSGAKTFAIAGGSLPTGLSISATTGAISGTPTGTAGTATFTVKVTDSATIPVTVTSGTYTITITAAPLVWVSPTAGTLTYTVGTPITPITLSTTGGTGTITYSVNSGTLPQGLQIVGNQVTGTPTAPTVVSGNGVSFLATDSATPTPVTAVSASVTLIANPVTLAITSSALPTGTVGAAYSYQLTSTGGTGAITWSLSAGSLTGTGLTLSSTDLLSGTPTTTQSGLSLTFQAKDSATNQQQTVTKTLSLTVTNVLAITTNTSLPNATTNLAYNQSLVAAGGSGSGYTWTVTAGATGTNSLATLNLSVSTAGVISGTPTSTGTANFTVQVKDSSNNTASASFTVNAYAALALPSPNPSSLGSATTNASYSGSITATGGVPGYTWTVNGSSVGSGSVSLGNGTLIASSSGSTLNITGTPASTGTVTFTASVTDSTSASVGPIAYSINVSSTYTVSGQINSNIGCTGVSLNGVTVSINTTPVQTTTTSGSGNFSFSNVPNGTYTITPSVVGPSSVFYPATQSVTVNGSDFTAANFNATLGYTVSGTVAYTGAQTGQIYLTLNSSNCGNGSLGTSISATGAFTIRGVPPGVYTLQALMDNLGQGAANASNPSNVTTVVLVTTANLSGVIVSLSDPATVTLTTAPKLSGVGGFNTGALAQFKAITNSSGVEMATSYTLQWSTTSTFTTIAGSKTFPANGTHTNVWFVNGLTNGSVYYFRAYGTSAGTPISPYSSTVGPITIGTPTGGNTVTGSVSFTSTATGPLYTGFFDQNTGNFYGEYFANPVSAQAYSIQVPSGSNYFFVGVIDQNNDGVVDAGDITDTGNGGSNAVTVISGATSNENLTLPSTNGIAMVTTQNYQSIYSGGSSQGYNLSFQVNGLIKQPVAVTLVSGPNVINPVDIGVCGGVGSNCGQGSQIYFNIGSTAPTVNDTYTLNVTYSDGTTGALTAKVTAILNAFATSLAPQTGTSVSTAPTFTWTYPTNASSYTYQFYMNDSNGDTIWQIPGSNSKSNGFSSTTTSITWGTDPTGGGSTPSVGSLTLGTNYNWQIQVQDSNGNSAVTQVQYQP
jgi:hypothetical protein